MKQTVEEAARENILYNHRTVDRTLHGKDLAKFGEENFIQGAEWKIDSVWCNADEKPKDGEYLTILGVNGKTVVEIAPWRNGEYQGTYHIGVYFGDITVVKYVDVHDLLPKGGIE